MAAPACTRPSRRRRSRTRNADRVPPVCDSLPTPAATCAPDGGTVAGSVVETRARRSPDNAPRPHAARIFRCTWIKRSARPHRIRAPHRRYRAAMRSLSRETFILLTGSLRRVDHLSGMMRSGGHQRIYQDDKLFRGRAHSTPGLAQAIARTTEWAQADAIEAVRHVFALDADKKSGSGLSISSPRHRWWWAGRLSCRTL